MAYNFQIYINVPLSIDQVFLVSNIDILMCIHVIDKHGLPREKKVAFNKCCM